AHRDLLDAFGGHLGEAGRVAELWKRWREREQEFSRHRARVEAAARERDHLRASVTELSEAEPQPGEESELALARADMMRAEKSAVDIAEARDLLSGGESPIPQLSTLLRRLQRKAADAPGLL